MKALLLGGLAIALLFGLYIVVVAAIEMWEDHKRSRAGVTDPRAQKLRANHGQLAQWVGHVLADDMIRPLIPEDKQEKARDLLAEYYDEGTY